MFSCEFCDSFRNTFIVEWLLLNNSREKKMQTVHNIVTNSLEGCFFNVFGNNSQ